MNQNQIENMEAENCTQIENVTGLTKSDLKEILKNKHGNTQLYFGSEKIIDVEFVGNKLIFKSVEGE